MEAMIPMLLRAEGNANINRPNTLNKVNKPTQPTQPS
jgi:hypothetical protein